MRALKVLVAPDSFKGSLDAVAVAQRMAAGVRAALPGAQVRALPIADGGEGTAEAIAAALGGTWRRHVVLDANGQPREVPVAVCDSAALGRFAAFDVARIVGLPDAVVAPGLRTTAGVGELIARLHGAGLNTIVIGLGGSSTTDAGAGLLGAIACECSDAAGTPVAARLDTLDGIAALRRRPDTAWLDGMRIIALTDVTSPLVGPRGAAHVFGAQKGLTDLVQADALLARFAALAETAFDGAGQLALLPGAGAAGGIGFGLALLGATLRDGAEFILDACGLAMEIGQYDWVITGEGRSDAQTMMGKGPAAVAALARRKQVPVSLLSGAVEASAELDAAFDGCFSIAAGPLGLDEAMASAGPLLEQAAGRLARLFDAARRRSANN